MSKPLTKGLVRFSEILWKNFALPLLLWRPLKRYNVFFLQKKTLYRFEGKNLSKISGESNMIFHLGFGVRCNNHVIKKNRSININVSRVHSGLGGVKKWNPKILKTKQ